MQVREAELEGLADQDEGELADLRERDRDDDRGVQGIAQRPDENERSARLAEEDDREDGEHLERRVDEDVPVKEHAHADEEEHGEGVLQGERIGGGAMGEAALAHHHAREEAAEGEGDVEELRGAVGDAHRDGEHEEREELARARAGDLAHGPRQDPAARDEHHDDEDRRVEEGLRNDPEELRVGDAVQAPGHPRHHDRREGRQDHEDEHRREVLDDEPADGDAAVSARELAPDVQRLEEHHGRGARERDAEDDRLPPGAVEERMRAEGAERRGDRHLQDRAGHGDALHGPEVLHREVQADAEHQQHHADLGELIGERRVGDDAWRVLACGDAGEKITHKGRGLQEALGNEAEDKREREGDDKSRDERERMFHCGARASRILGLRLFRPLLRQAA